MRNGFFCAIIAAAFVSASFTEVHIAPNGKAAQGPAYPYHGSYTNNFDGVEFENSCTGEVMTLSGSVQVNYHGVYKEAKSSFNTLHINVQGIKAVGESGRVYRISGTNNIKEMYSYANGVYTIKAVQNERWTTSGPGNNFTISTTYYVTFDAYGNVTVKRDEFETYCQ